MNLRRLTFIRTGAYLRCLNASLILYRLRDILTTTLKKAHCTITETTMTMPTPNMANPYNALTDSPYMTINAAIMHPIQRITFAREFTTFSAAGFTSWLPRLRGVFADFFSDRLGLRRLRMADILVKILFHLCLGLVYPNITVFVNIIKFSCR